MKATEPTKRNQAFIGTKLYGDTQIRKNKEKDDAINNLDPPKESARTLKCHLGAIK